MPTYEYKCPDCGIVEKLHAIGEAPFNEICPHCDSCVSRVFSAPLVSRSSDQLRAAFDRAEKSRGEPTVIQREHEAPRRSKSDQTNPALQKLVGKEAAKDLRSAPQFTPHR